MNPQEYGMSTVYKLVSLLCRLLFIAYIAYVFVVHFSGGIGKGLQTGFPQATFFVSILLVLTFLSLIMPGFVPLGKLMYPGEKLEKLIKFDAWIFGLFILVLCIGAVLQHGERIAQRQSGPKVAEDCTYDSALQRNARSGAEAYRTRFEQCLQEKNIPTEYIGEPFSTVLTQLPSNPGSFVGKWTMESKGCVYGVNLKANGFYRFAPIKCRSRGGIFKGIWAVIDDEMIWIPVQGTPDQIDKDEISSIEKDSFTLIESDGSSSRFSRVTGQP